MNVFEVLALMDWITPAISGGKQVRDGMVTWPAYQGGGKDLELASRVLAKAGIEYKHHGMARSLFVHPDDLDRADKSLRDAGYTVKNTGFIKKPR